MTSSSHLSSPALSISAEGSSITSTTVNPATGSRSSMSTISDFWGSAPTTIVRCRKCPYRRSCRSQERSAQRTINSKAKPVTKVIRTNPRDRSILKANTTIATAPKTVAVAATTRLNSSEPTPSTRVSYAPRSTKTKTHAITTITTSDTYVGSLISTLNGIAQRRMKPVMPAKVTAKTSKMNTRMA